MLHFRGFSHKNSGIIIVCSGLEKVSFIFYWEEGIGNVLNVVSATFFLVCFVCLKERICETRKKIYFTSKALFILEIIKF